MNNVSLNQNQPKANVNLRQLHMGRDLYRAYDAKNNKFSTPTPQSQIKMQAQPEQDEFSTATNAIGAAGLLRLAQYGIEKLSGICASALMAGKEFTSAQDVEKIAQKMKADNGLSAEIHYIDNSNKLFLQRKFPQLAKSLDTVANGGNAFYTNQGNFAVAPKSKPSLILHELGHATNFEKSTIMKGLQKLRAVGAFAPMAIAYLNRASGPKNDGKKNFWERNAGTIGFCAFLPTIIEEATASIRGINAAKKTLGSSAKLGALKKNYFLAWMTYVLAGVGVGIASKLAITGEK